MTRNVSTELARLDAEARRAGLSLACPHQSAEEFHGALIRRYRALHPRRRFSPALAVFVLALGAGVTLIWN